MPIPADILIPAIAGMWVIGATLSLTFGRRHRARIMAIWDAARWWERVLLGVALMPIPGPVDEIIGALVIVRITRRIARSRSVGRQNYDTSDA